MIFGHWMRESIFSMTSSFLTHEAAIVQVRKKGEKKHSVQKLLLKYEQHLLPFLVYLLAYPFFFNVGQRIHQLSKTNQPGTNENVKSQGGLKAFLALIDPEDRSRKKRWGNWLHWKFLYVEFQPEAEKKKKALRDEELIYMSYFFPWSVNTSSKTVVWFLFSLILKHQASQIYFT